MIEYRHVSMTPGCRSVAMMGFWPCAYVCLHAQSNVCMLHVQELCCYVAKHACIAAVLSAYALWLHPTHKHVGLHVCSHCCCPLHIRLLRRAAFALHLLSGFRWFRYQCVTWSCYLWCAQQLVVTLCAASGNPTTALCRCRCAVRPLSDRPLIDSSMTGRRCM